MRQPGGIRRVLSDDDRDPCQRLPNAYPGDGVPTAAFNNLIKRIKRVGFGFRRFRNYRVRALLYAGRPNWAAIRKLLMVLDQTAPWLAARVRGVLTRDDDYATLGKPPCDWDDRAAREHWSTRWFTTRSPRSRCWTVRCWRGGPRRSGSVGHRRWSRRRRRRPRRVRHRAGCRQGSGHFHRGS
jgi:hypothetical protein